MKIKKIIRKIFFIHIAIVSTKNTILINIPRFFGKPKIKFIKNKLVNNLHGQKIREIILDELGDE